MTPTLPGTSKRVADKGRRPGHTAAMPSLRPLAAACSLVLMSALAAAQPAARPAATNSEAAAACERAARQSLATQGTPVADLKFIGTPALQPGLSNENQVVLQGAGSWRAAGGQRSFDYSCNVDLRTPEAVGVVIRDTTPATESAPARARREPDLSFVSPAACESSAAAALKQLWPRVSQISFDSSTRSLSQESASKAELHGHGRALPSPGSPSTHFGFDCEIDPRDGRILGTRVSG